MSIHSIGKRRADRDLPAFVPAGARHVPQIVYVVLDEDDVPIYSCSERDRAHRWINTAINSTEDGTSVARHWVVREYRIAPGDKT